MLFITHPTHNPPLFVMLLVHSARVPLRTKPRPSDRVYTPPGSPPHLVLFVQDEVFSTDRARAAADPEREVNVAEVAIGLLEERPAADVFLLQFEFQLHPVRLAARAHTRLHAPARSRQIGILRTLVP